MDPHPNGAYSTVATPPIPALSGVTLTLAAGTGVRFGWTGQPFNVTIYPAGQRPVPSNMEIARLTNLVGDVCTITRTQETTAARAILAGDQIQATVTEKVLTDIEDRGYVTVAAEAMLPNSRRLVAGANITFDTTTPGELGIAGSAGGGGNVTDTGPDATPPVGAIDGDLYFPNDVQQIYRFSGTLWVPWGPIRPLTKPIDGDFAWINQGGSSVDTARGGILLTVPATAGASLRLRVKAIPAVPYTITAEFDCVSGKITSTGAYYGLAFRQSSDGKLHLLLVYMSSAGEILSIKFTDATTFSGLYGGSIVLNTLPIPLNKFPLRFLRISDSGGNRVLSYSGDGLEWTQLSTIGRTDFLTANQVGFFVNAQDVAQGASVRLISWKET